MASKRFQFNEADAKAWATQALKFLAPYLIALIPVIIKQVPQDWAYAVAVVWVLNRLWSALTLWYSGK